MAADVEHVAHHLGQAHVITRPARLVVVIALALVAAAPLPTSVRPEGSLTTAPTAPTAPVGAVTGPLVRGEQPVLVRADAQDPLEAALGARTQGVDPTVLATFDALRADAPEGALLDAVAAMVRDRWGVTPVRLDGTATGPEATATEVVVASGVVGAPIATIDVDGDGHADTIFGTSDVATGELGMLAVRGVDGTTLWRTVGTGTQDLVWDAGDLDGDGVHDLLAVELDATSDTTERCPDHLTDCDITQHVDLTWDLSVWSGAGGQHRWSGSWDSTYDAEYARIDDEERQYFLLRQAYGGHLVLPAITTDHDGDGGLDLVLNLVDHDLRIEDDIRWDGLVGQRTASDRRRGATTVTVLRGADGTTTSTHTKAVNGLVTMDPLGDATGDPTPDLLWAWVSWPDGDFSCPVVRGVPADTCVGLSTIPDLTVEAVDGSTGARAWQRAVTIGNLWEFHLPLRRDVDGDGRTDLLLAGLGGDSATGLHQELHLVSGVDGSATWTVEGNGRSPMLVAELGGATGSDVLLGSAGTRFRFCALASGPPDAGECQDRVELYAEGVGFELATGDRVVEFDHAHTLGEAGATWTVRTSPVVDDVTGDGVPELYITGGDWGEGRAQYTVTHLLDPSTGEVVEEIDVDGYHRSWTSPDLDGDGRGDLLEVHATDRQVPLDDRIMRARALGTDTPFWETPYLDARDLWYAGDADGLPGQELLRVTNPDEGGTRSIDVQLLDGASLAPRWRIRLG